MPLKKGGYNLSFYITAMNALDTKDYQAIEGLMHEDFIWMNGYEMKTLDEWLEGLREEFKKDFTFNERTCLFESPFPQRINLFFLFFFICKALWIIAGKKWEVSKL